MQIIIKVYSLINYFLEIFWFKLDYIWSHRYQWIKDLHISTLIDVWANKWQTIDKYKNIRNNTLNIHSFEPMSAAFSILKKKFQDDFKITLYNIWLWTKKEKKIMHIYDHDDSSSLLDIWKEGKSIYHYSISYDQSIYIDTLDSIFSEKDLQWWIMMKIDVQWYELNVLKWWEKFIKRVKIVVIELSFVELYKSQKLFDEAYDRLYRRWFIYSWSLEQAGNPDNWQPLQQDAIFINKNI